MIQSTGERELSLERGATSLTERRPRCSLSLQPPLPTRSELSGVLKWTPLSLDLLDTVRVPEESAETYGGYSRLKDEP